MDKIKFGTDGWRAIIAKEFTVENVARVSEATGLWLQKNYENPKTQNEPYRKKSQNQIPLPHRLRATLQHLLKKHARKTTAQRC